MDYAYQYVLEELDCRRDELANSIQLISDLKEKLEKETKHLDGLHQKMESLERALEQLRPSKEN